MTTHDEARGRREGDGARPRWAFGWVHQFDLIRASDGVRYLTRWWLVNTPLGGIAVHRMDGPDARTVIHDHPFTFASRVLRGGYVEERLDPLTMQTHERKVRRWNRMRKYDAHTIKALLRVPTWTLVFVGPKRRTWGFWQPAEWDGADGIWLWTEHKAFDSGHDLGTEVRV